MKRAPRLLQFRLATLFTVVTAVAVLLGAFQALTLWNKSDFCRGWGEHYAREASQFRQLALNPSLSTSDVTAYLDAAQQREHMSKLYLKVAKKPWLPYPWNSQEWQRPASTNSELRSTSDSVTNPTREF